MAVDKYSEAEITEQIKLAYLEYQTERVYNSNADLEIFMRTNLGKIYGTVKVTITKIGENLKIDIEGLNKTYMLKLDGTIIERDKMVVTPVYAKVDGNKLKLRASLEDGYNEYISSCSSLEQSNSETIETVIIEEPIAPNNGYDFFCGLSNLKNIENMEYLHTENIQDMSYMFSKCSSLTNIDLSNFNTKNVTSMSSLFRNCSSLVCIDVSGFNTRNVINMESMFKNCSNLTTIDLKNFNTCNVTNMGNMFDMPDDHKTSNLKTIIFGINFITSKVNNMNYMFTDCGNLETIYVANEFDTSKVETSQAMFQWDSKLIGGNGTKYNVSHINKNYAKIDKEGQQGYFTYKNVND